MRRHAVHPARAARAAFTVVELLVVVVIILIVLTIATPAFQALVYSSQRSRAVNSVNAAALSARELALRSASGDDAAVVFVYDRTGVMRVIPAVRVGSIFEPVIGQPPQAGGVAQPLGALQVRRDVFAPVPDVTSFEMPAFWNVRGYASSRSMLEFVPGNTPRQDVALWYNSPMYGGRDPNAPEKAEANWVFPETAFFDVDQQSVQPGANAPTARQSFMIRFDARTGGVSANRDPAIFVDPRPSTVNRPGNDRPDAADRWLRPDRAENLVVWANGIISSRERLPAISMTSNDTVLVKPVSRIALYDERVMARDIGARRLNAVTNSLYRSVERGSGGAEIQIDPELFPGGVPGDIRQRINRWINGDTNFNGEFDDDDQPQARLYIVQPTTGELAEVLR